MGIAYPEQQRSWDAGSVQGVVPLKHPVSGGRWGRAGSPGNCGTSRDSGVPDHNSSLCYRSPQHNSIFLKYCFLAFRTGNKRCVLHRTIPALRQQPAPETQPSAQMEARAQGNTSSSVFLLRLNLGPRQRAHNEKGLCRFTSHQMANF